MVKKVKLIDDTVVDVATEQYNGSMSKDDVKSMMKFLEAIDWKLWEMLKILKSETEEK